MPQEEVEKVLAKAGDSKNRKLVNIGAYFEETKRQMTDVLKKSTMERDKIKNELKQLQEDNRRYRNELEACERRSREKRQMEVISDSDIEEIERIARMVPKVLEDLQHDKEGFVTNLAAIDTATKMVDKINGEYKRESKQIDKDFKLARLEYKMVMNERQNEIDHVKKQIADLQVKTDAQILPKKKRPGLLSYRKQLSRIFRCHHSREDQTDYGAI
ncbi:hypothetical protein ACROYT_G034470 [Oculina patagonica]